MELKLQNSLDYLTPARFNLWAGISTTEFYDFATNPGNTTEPGLRFILVREEGHTARWSLDLNFAAGQDTITSAVTLNTRTIQLNIGRDATLGALQEVLEGLEIEGYEIRTLYRNAGAADDTPFDVTANWPDATPDLATLTSDDVRIDQGLTILLDNPRGAAGNSWDLSVAFGALDASRDTANSEIDLTIAAASTMAAVKGVLDALDGVRTEYYGGETGTTVPRGFGLTVADLQGDFSDGADDGKTIKSASGYYSGRFEIPIAAAQAAYPFYPQAIWPDADAFKDKHVFIKNEGTEAFTVQARTRFANEPQGGLLLDSLGNDEQDVAAGDEVELDTSAPFKFLDLFFKAAAAAEATVIIAGRK